ncbi:glycoside hydrolase domain-containing protein [Canibacter zhoujuaniae]|uniref:glycoside hydrolase domain-containing protein n=1 Tax=Canibacter zhoujuaniae TaxID=2708343 RepID=UPI0014222291|nr:glycoside hydrolase domain-containing protein [Canibacter zhoujuaniae]
MSDQMVLEAQRWLNRTYGDKTGFGSVAENGKTGWATINALIRALQIELGITSTVNNFGPGTQSRFKNRWPNGITQNSTKSNIHGIIQCALWCKGYPAEYGGITSQFTLNVADSIRALKSDIGIANNSTIDLEMMMALLSMKQFRLLADYGGKLSIRAAQQSINRHYKNYTGIIPTDGLYGREMNIALIQVLQAIQGFTPEQATGNFGPGTRSRLQTINGGTSQWVWLTTVALICNDYSLSPTSTWNGGIANHLSQFQHVHALPVTGVVDPTTWMSLLTSKGDPNRACIACDTRFEITDEFAGYLKSDGYKIVGRYLTEPGQENLAESEYFKALRTGELERIVSHGLQYFPIFQEYSTALRHFTAETGARHAAEAQAAAQRLGIPATVIYFAVDYDATDTEVTSNILPYFQSVKANLKGGYRVGIYAPRNICTRVASAGYSVASFVSDMSTGFSGNLGFPIPNNWVFDQFHEISRYRGKWDLDRVAFSGRIAAVGSVLPSGANPQPTVSYKAPPAPNLATIMPFSQVLPLIRNIESAYSKFAAGDWENYATHPDYRPSEVVPGVLRYLARDYLQDWKFAVSAGTSKDIPFELYFEEQNPEVISSINPYISAQRTPFTDANRQGKNDLAHLTYTLYCYLYTNLTPDHWAGWAGDLATGMRDVHRYIQAHPDLDRTRVANSLIGADPAYPATYFINAGVDTNSLGVSCNFTDICDDADAIALSSMVKQLGNNGIRSLSSAMEQYYGNIITSNRYSVYEYDGLDYSSVDALYNTTWNRMNGVLEGLPYGLLDLAGNSSQEERQACVRAFANYLFNRSR